MEAAGQRSLRSVDGAFPRANGRKLAGALTHRFLEFFTGLFAILAGSLGGAVFAVFLDHALTRAHCLGGFGFRSEAEESKEQENGSFAHMQIIHDVPDSTRLVLFYRSTSHFPERHRADGGVFGACANAQLSAVPLQR